MSVEQHRSKPTQDPEQFRIPDQAPVHGERTDDLNEKRDGNWLTRHWKQVTAVGTAGLALAVGLSLGLKGEGSSAKEGQGTVATAPANPSHEASPSTAAYDPNNYQTWTSEHVPLEIVGANGKVDTYDSVKAYSESLAIPGISPEDLSKDPKQYADHLLAAVNSYMVSVSNPEAYDKYKAVPAPDADSYGSTGAVLDQYVKPGFEQAIVGEAENGASMLGSDNTQEWLGDLNTLAHSYNHFNAVTNGQYSAKWQLDPSSDTPVGYNTYDQETGSIHIFMRVKLTDNLDQTSLAGQKNADGSDVASLGSTQLWNMEVQRQADGMRIISMSSEQVTTM